MNYFLTEEQEMICELAAKIAKEKIAPVALEYDEQQVFPQELIKIMGQSDLFGVFIPEEFGGLGGGVFEMCLVVEELSKACGGIALAYAASAMGSIPIMLYGSDEQKQKYLPRLATGEILAAFAFSEEGADRESLKTKAELQGDAYVINGSKQWIANGGDADIYTVIAVTDPAAGPEGTSAFLLEKGTQGFEFGKKNNTMGLRATSNCELVFTDCRVPKTCLLGNEGQGLAVAATTFDRFRPAMAAEAVGIGAGGLEKAVGYSRERYQRGQTISSFQGIQFMLAEMATQVEAARALTYQAAKSIDAGAEDGAKLSSMAKIFASNAAMKVATDAVQIFAGYGYTKEYPVEKLMRDAKITQIFEGSSQIPQEVIALQLIKENAAQKG